MLSSPHDRPGTHGTSSARAPRDVRQARPRRALPCCLVVVGVLVGMTGSARASATSPLHGAAHDPPVAARLELAAAGALGTGRPQRTAGSAPLGTAGYAAPAGAIFVSPTGDDDSPGTSSAPRRTVNNAVATAPSGATLVLRAGNYHERVIIPTGKRLTVQAAAGERVWFDGSRRLSNWVADGSAWRSDGWTARFDHSPTYTPGAPDNTTPGWSFVNAAHPLAAYPEMLFVDGAPQRQVASRAEVTSGTFYVDTAGSHLYMGSNPAGRAVQASDLSTGITVRGAGSVLRGFGVRRYATSVPQKGSVLALAPRVTLQDLVVSDNATQGIYVGGMYLGTDNVLKRLTVERNGLLGIESSYADRLRLEGVRATGNNTEHFNMSPVSGGAKITRARGVTVTGSALSRNEGPGLWLDESVYDATVTGNDLVGNLRHGLSFEISAKGVFADNLVAGNAGNGMKLNNSADVRVWNNTFVDNGDKPVWLVQDPRQASNLSTPGHDPRQAQPDPTMTWTTGPAVIKNNIFARTSAICLVCVEDTALRRSAATIGVTLDGNVYQRAAANAPTWMVVWASGAVNPAVFSTLPSFRTTTGQEAHGTEMATSPVDAGYAPTAALRDLQPTTAQPLDAAVAALTGRSAGERHLGVWGS